MTPDTDTRCRIFTELTAHLEDAAGLAADGQSMRLSDVQVIRLVRQIRALNKKAETLLDQLT